MSWQRSRRELFRRIGACATVVVAAATARPAPAQARAGAGGGKGAEGDVYVFVHGAYHSGELMEPVARHMRAEGHELLFTHPKLAAQKVIEAGRD